jgi:hypothetical protein
MTMKTTPYRRSAAPWFFWLAALVGCAGGGDPASVAEPAAVTASEGCEDATWLAENDITLDECLDAAVVAYDPNSGEANSCTPGTLIHKAVDPGPPRLVFVCKCRRTGQVECFLRN